MTTDNDDDGVMATEPVSSPGQVVQFPNLSTGSLADLLSAASAPAQPHELTWEHGIRAVFQTERLGWPKARRRIARTSIAALAIGTGLIGGSAGLAAATGFPAPAARIVNQIFDAPKQAAPSVASSHRLDGSPPPGQSTGQNQSTGSGSSIAAARRAATTSTCAGNEHRLGPISTSGGHCFVQDTAAASVNSRPAGTVSAAIRHQVPSTVRATRSETKPPAGDHGGGPGTVRGGNKGTVPGTDRGGNKGTGLGADPNRTGASRGSNRAVGTNATGN